MVKSKKMSKTSIAVIILALLLVLSMVLGFTGAWFTDKATGGTAEVVMKFGTVNYTAFAADTKVHNKIAGVDNAGLSTGDEGYTAAEAHYDYPAVSKASNVQQDDGKWLVTAGTRVSTSIGFTNSSTVDTYYILVQDAKYYVIDQANKYLVDVTTKSNYSDALGKLTVGTSRNLAFTFTMKDGDDNGSTDIWTISAGGPAIGSYTNVVEYDADIDLGLLLFNGAFELRVVQAANVENAGAAWDLLVGASAITVHEYPTV